MMLSTMILSLLKKMTMMKTLPRPIWRQGMMMIWLMEVEPQVEEQEDGGMGAVLARLGVGSNEEVPAAVADRAGGDDDEDEDPLAAMRRMMAQHGGESDED